MALPTTGPISLSDVNVELSRSATAPISLGESDVRNLAERASGFVGLSDLRGKSSVFAFSITANQTNANLRTLAVNAGWDENSAVEATINSGVVISGNTHNNSTAALTINGSFPNGVTLINNGVIHGRGGNAGVGGAASATGDENTRTGWADHGSAGVAGGRALLASVPVSIQNNNTIAGGGGGGGGGGGVSRNAHIFV